MAFVVVVLLKKNKEMVSNIQQQQQPIVLKMALKVSNVYDQAPMQIIMVLCLLILGPPLKIMMVHTQPKNVGVLEGLKHLNAIALKAEALQRSVSSNHKI